MKNINDISQRDWRLQAITTLSKDWKSPFTGKIHKAGTVVENVNPIKVSNKAFNMPNPNPTALFISLSNNNFLNAREFLKFFTEKNFESLDLRQEEEDFFNGLECLMASIIFAYTALESFSNETTPDNYKFQLVRDDKRCIEIYDKEQIERNLSLKTKLGLILPEVTGIEFPKGELLWNELIELENIRNDIIHMKSKDRIGVKGESGEIVFGHIWNRILSNGNFKNYSIISTNIIIMFSKDKESRWLKLFRK